VHDEAMSRLESSSGRTPDGGPPESSRGAGPDLSE
jgi:hypothetical protein